MLLLFGYHVDVVNKDDVPMFVLGDRIGDEGTSDTAGPECIGI